MVSLGLYEGRTEQEVATEQEVESPPLTLKHGLANCGYKLSGICTGQCMKVLNKGSDAVFGKDADNLSAVEAASINGNVTEGFKVRKATDAEQAQGFKLVFTY